jgi:hypothetical protein
VGKQATEFEFTVETMERAAQGWGEARNEMECQQCGARTTLPINNLTHTCSFCGSNQVIQRLAPQDILRPRFLVPFQIEVEDCLRISHQWIGSSWMTPSSLRHIGVKASFSGVYLPYWTFDAVTVAGWKAEVGHAKQERYYDGGEWKERTVIEWRWESGHVRQNIDDLIIDGTTRLSTVLLDRINNFDMRALVPYEPNYLAGMRAHAYELSLEDAWRRGREKMREQTREACLKQASTERVRNFSMKLDFSEESWRYILLPVYLSAYNYQNQIYQVMINGQTGAIAGQRPVEWVKVWLIILALLAPGLLLGFFGLITLIFAGIGIFIGAVGLFLLVIGLIFGFWILREAQAMDDA